ncbi:MAG TPA: D-2-hydroxyacid dehydrogenase, partial [Vicinamibacteria bacterium]|nr:D-2-hydroxyacid dehydrogenase [Vicinamibacteria bacterium]
VCSVARALPGTLARAPGARWVQSRSAGVETLLYPGRADAGVVLTNGKGAFSPSLAEFVMAAVFHFAKDVRRLIRNQAGRRWEQYVPAMVEGQTLGIVGYGDIGRATAGKARAMGMRIAALRRRESAAPDPLLETTFPAAQLRQLMAWSDVVLLATPLTPDTHGLVGAEEIGAMKPTAILVNVGRGPVVVEAALVEALRGGRIAGAALDVFETEPLPPESPFWSLENVLLSPHCADQVEGWLEPAMQCFRANLERFVAGEPLLNVVDPRRGY